MVKNPMIFMIGDDGAGKTMQALSLPDQCEDGKKIVCFDRENKAEETIDGFYPDKMIKIVPMFVYHETEDKANGIRIGSIDTLKTIKKMEDELSHYSRKNDDVSYFVFDGVSGLRSLYTEKWLNDNPVVKGNVITRRTGIAKENLGAWAEINNNVKDLLFSFINACRMRKKTVIFTCKTKEDYKNLEDKDGGVVSIKMPDKVPDVKDWALFEMSVKCTLSKDKAGKYWVQWHRAPVPNLKEKEEITGKDLYSVMVNNGILG